MMGGNSLYSRKSGPASSSTPASEVEFDTARARRLAREILRGVAVVEEGWVGGAPGREVSIQAAWLFYGTSASMYQCRKPRLIF